MLFICGESLFIIALPNTTSAPTLCYPSQCLPPLTRHAPPGARYRAPQILLPCSSRPGRRTNPPTDAATTQVARLNRYPTSPLTIHALFCQTRLSCPRLQQPSRGRRQRTEQSAAAAPARRPVALRTSGGVMHRATGDMLPRFWPDAAALGGNTRGAAPLRGPLASPRWWPASRYNTAVPVSVVASHAPSPPARAHTPQLLLCARACSLAGLSRARHHLTTSQPSSSSTGRAPTIQKSRVLAQPLRAPFVGDTSHGIFSQ